MAEDSIRMDPYYTADELQVISVAELRERVSHIHDKRAQQVAHELWRRMDIVFTVRDPAPRRFLQDSRNLRELAGPLGTGPLLDMLRRLRSANFPRVLDGIADPTKVQGEAILPGRRRKRHIHLESAAQLHEQLESVIHGGARMPFHIQRNWTCGIVLCCLPVWAWLGRDWLWDRFQHGFWMIPATLFGILLAYGLWYRLTFWVQDKMRILALYMAFTDFYLEEGGKHHGMMGE